MNKVNEASPANKVSDVERVVIRLLPTEYFMDFDERCKLVEKCLPESQFKEQIVKLHAEMLDCIAGLAAACDSLSADNYELSNDV